jgi:hypothetical protein
MFDPRVVVQIDLTLSDEALAALAADPRRYVPATFSMSYRQRRYGPWGIALKLKGQLGSFRGMDGKAAFKLKLPSGSRPDGLKKMTLNNMVQDASKVHEAVAYELFRDMGVAAPRTGYASVTVNGASYGLYLNLETLDDVSLARWYPATQHLYEGSYGFVANPTDPFDAHYEVDEGDGDDRADLAGLLVAAGAPSAGWYARMAKIADLEQMTRMWATEAYVGHWDGYSGPITNNYYLHSDGAGRFTMLPWGTDQALGARTGFYDGSWHHPLFNGCVADPICGSLYADALAAVQVAARRGRLGARVATIYRGIRSHLDADPKLEHSIADSRTALAATVGFTRARPADFADWSAGLPAGPRSVAAKGIAGAIAVRWTAPTARSGPAITGYAVEFRRAVAAAWTRVEAARSATAYTIAGLPAGRYEVRVRTLAEPGASTKANVKAVTVHP